MVSKLLLKYWLGQTVRSATRPSPDPVLKYMLLYGIYSQGHTELINYMVMCHGKEKNYFMDNLFNFVNMLLETCSILNDFNLQF